MTTLTIGCKYQRYHCKSSFDSVKEKTQCGYDICPMCGVDAVIPTDHLLTWALLEWNKKWFGETE